MLEISVNKILPPSSYGLSSGIWLSGRVTTQVSLAGGVEWPWGHCPICGQQGTNQDAPIKITDCVIVIIISSECADVKWDAASAADHLPARASTGAPVHGTP
jgi:hypothetical protein